MPSPANTPPRIITIKPTVIRAMRPLWLAPSPRHWQIINGLCELFIDKDYDFLLVGEGPVLADKITGELVELPSLYDVDYLNTFTPVGDAPYAEG